MSEYTLEKVLRRVEEAKTFDVDSERLSKADKERAEIHLAERQYDLLGVKDASCCIEKIRYG